MVRDNTENSLIALVTRAQGGDPAATDALVRRFQDFAVACARSYLPERTLAEDAAQDALVEALACLPTLRAPAAFPVFLRRIVLKRADRLRRVQRPTVPLDTVAETPGGIAPEDVALERDRAATLRQTVDALSDTSREAILLFYLGGRSLTECAAFLDVPVSTVKSRLHDARRRLRKELSVMIEETLQSERPSRNDEFAGRVMARLTFAFEEQMQANPHTADRALLTQARTQLNHALADPPLTPETVRAARYLLERQRDFPALADLMTRYDRQRLSPAESAWSRWWRLWALLAAGASELLFSEQPAFVEEIGARIDHGEIPRLRAWWPYEPAPDDATDAMDPGALRLWAIGVPSDLWQREGRGDEWIALATRTLEAAGATPGNRLNRFHVWRALAELYLTPAGRLAEADALIARIATLAEEETDPIAAERWRLEERTTRLHHLATQGQADTARIVGAETIVRIDTLAARLAPDNPWWLKTFRHNAACSLAGAKAYDLALALFETVIATNPGNGYAWLRHASVVWAMTADRPRTLALLREAAARDDRDLATLIRNHPSAAPEFAPLLDDSAFQEALRRPSP